MLSKSALLVIPAYLVNSFGMFRNQSKKGSTWSRLLHGRRDRNELITKGILKQAYFGSSIQEILKQEKVILTVQIKGV